MPRPTSCAPTTWPSSLIGTPGQLQEQLAAYAEAGVDELIIPDFTLGGGNQQDETLDRFLAEVAAPFRS